MAINIKKKKNTTTTEFPMNSESTATPPVTTYYDRIASVPVRPYFWGTCLPLNYKDMNLKESQILLSRLAFTVNELRREIDKLKQEHEECEQQSQIEIYAMQNLIKDLEERHDGPYGGEKCECDAEYYLHKYLVKKKLLR